MIQVEVTPNDGTVDGATVVSNTITISNTPPSITSVAISPSTLNNESIATCIASGWVDDDGDVEGYEYAWTVNGAVHQDTTQSSGPFNVDEVISCTVTPNDGEDSGPAVSSLDVTVDATDAPDADGDGVPDNTDTCPNTEASEVVDMYGCSASQRDGDGDGVSDADDVCPGSPVGATVDNEGCAASQLDSDEDGFADDVDVFPSDAGEHADADEDGICDILDDDDDDDGWDDTTEEDCSTSSIDSHSTPLDTDGDGICDNLDTNDDNVPEPETVTEPDPVTTDVTNNDIPGFTSVLMFTAIAGALIFLRRRPND
jgi:hypothetical protein